MKIRRYTDEKFGSLTQFNVPYDSLELTPEFLFTCLGYRKQKPEKRVRELVINALAEAGRHFEIVAGYRIFDSFSIQSETGQVFINRVEFNPQIAITSCFSGAAKIAVFVCTAGEGATKWVQSLSDQKKMAQAFIVDAVASATVEAGMDLVQQYLAQTVAKDQEQITQRYSPGYCGWNVNEQHALFSLIPDDFCKIRLLSSAMMVPLKSISGIIGIGAGAISGVHPCRLCDKEDCFRRKI